MSDDVQDYFETEIPLTPEQDRSSATFKSPSPCSNEGKTSGGRPCVCSPFFMSFPGVRIEPRQPPSVTVEVVERVLVHEAVVLRLVRFRASRGNGLRHHCVDRLAAVERQTQE